VNLIIASNYDSVVTFTVACITIFHDDDDDYYYYYYYYYYY